MEKANSFREFLVEKEATEEAIPGPSDKAETEQQPLEEEASEPHLEVET